MVRTFVMLLLFPLCLSFPKVGFGKFSMLSYEQLRDTQPAYAEWVLETRFRKGSAGTTLKDWLRAERGRRKGGASKAPLIANVVGSSSDKPKKFGYSTWKDVWLASTGRSWPRLCAYSDCKNIPNLGGHVYMKGERQMPFIVPICKSCNLSPSRDYNKGYSAPTRHVAVALPAPTGDMVDGKGYFSKRKTRKDMQAGGAGPCRLHKGKAKRAGNKIVTREFGRLADGTPITVTTTDYVSPHDDDS
ncbi:hypothetical protein TrLO_g4503 [Triparma laevis f. longispina]|uniref:Uncharacterized protein n=1 Tax=Triparma laevis f. longispina TaxID=1714387 RepID=A0A9W6ZQX3_9STRA|nr:hypothetical protein TrLO_g4503 [Triparma laevis f. longispina]